MKVPFCKRLSIVYDLYRRVIIALHLKITQQTSVDSRSAHFVTGESTLPGSIFHSSASGLNVFFMCCYFLRRRGLSMIFSAATVLHANLFKTSSP